MWWLNKEYKDNYTYPLGKYLPLSNFKLSLVLLVFTVTMPSATHESTLCLHFRGTPKKRSLREKYITFRKKENIPLSEIAPITEAFLALFGY